jgi:branched-chain amino acid transport system permease protein
MLFRQAGIHHTDYASDRALFPVPADRIMIIGLLVLAVTAPLTTSSLTLSSYLLPWLVWTAATLGLNLILGWAGQFHFGYAAIMGIGAYASVHGARNGIPWEIAVVLGGLTATVIGSTFAFAALRVKGLYLALSTLALQFVMDWVISHVPAISGGTQATLQAPPMKLLGQAVTSEVGFYYVALGWCLIVTLVHAEPAPHRARPRARRGAREGLRRRGDRRAQLPLQAGRVREPRRSSAGSAARS